MTIGPLTINRRGLGVFCVYGGRWTLHVGLPKREWLWGYDPEYSFYDGPIGAIGAGWLGLLIWERWR